MRSRSSDSSAPCQYKDFVCEGCYITGEGDHRLCHGCTGELQYHWAAAEPAWSYFRASDLGRRQGKYMAAQSAGLQREAREPLHSSVVCTRTDYMCM